MRLSVVQAAEQPVHPTDDRLAVLADLHRAGFLTDTDYERMRRQLPRP